MAATPRIPGRVNDRTIFIIAMQPLHLLLAGTDIWMRFAAALVKLVA